MKIELETKVSCSITHAMAYTWTLLNETTGEAVDVQSVNPQVFRERTLYFPPRTLNYGNYTVHLEVRCHSPSPPVATIFMGGSVVRDEQKIRTHVCLFQSPFLIVYCLTKMSDHGIKASQEKRTLGCCMFFTNKFSSSFHI